MHFVWKWKLLDYATCIIFGLIGWLVGSYVPPHCRAFSFDDPTISNPKHDPETFPTYSVIIAVILIIILYILGEYYTWQERGKDFILRHLNSWILVQGFSICLEFCIVNLSKLYAGRPRPDFIHLLADEGITRDNFNNFTSAEVCRAAREGRLSFPSGHSGTAFAGFIPPVLYLLGLTGALRRGSLAAAALALLPLTLPITTAVSRTRDNDHHFSDIVAGALVGGGCGTLAVLVAFTPSPMGHWTLRGDAYTALRQEYPPSHTRGGRREEQEEEEMRPHTTAVSILQGGREGK